MCERRRVAIAACVAAVLVLTTSSCNSDDSTEATTDTAVTTTISEEMRPVPTVPVAPDVTDPMGASLPEGEVAAEDPPISPPTTELVGDPRPNPDSQATLPPLPDSPVVDACARLGDSAAVAQIGTAVGAGMAAEANDQICRFTGGSAVAEVHYIAEGALGNDWFRRDGIESVGDVIADAVGLASFVPPGSDVADGYTIALLYRRQGAVIAVRGSGDDRALAVQLANDVVASI